LSFRVPGLGRSGIGWAAAGQNERGQQQENNETLHRLVSFSEIGL
jgi:hypothetical protein